MRSWDIPPIHFKSSALPYNWPPRCAGGPSSPFSAPIAGTVEQRLPAESTHEPIGGRRSPMGMSWPRPLSWLIGQPGGRLGLRGWVLELVNPDHGEEKDRGGWWGKGAEYNLQTLFWRIWQKVPRNAANARERTRMRVLSKAFGRLKLTLPWVPPDTKVIWLNGDTKRGTQLNIRIWHVECRNLSEV